MSADRVRLTLSRRHPRCRGDDDKGLGLARSSSAATDVSAKERGHFAELGDITTALQEAEPEHKLDLYRSLRLRLTYSAETQTCTP